MKIPKDIKLYLETSGFFQSGKEKADYISDLINNDFAVKIKNLREDFETKFNAVLPFVDIMDNANIKPLEVIMYADEKVIFQKEADGNNFEKSAEAILREAADFLRKFIQGNI